MALGFNNGVPHESDVTKFVNKIGDDLDVYFVQLLKFIRENVHIEGIKAFRIIGFLQHSNRFGVRIKTRTGSKFTSYRGGKKRASTHWAGMTLILDALYGLGIINMIENIPAKKKIRGYPMLQISLTLIVKMITGLEDLHELENEVGEDPLLAMFCTIENDDTPCISTLSRDVERYSVADLRKSYKPILQWYDPICGILLDFRLFPINQADNPNRIPLIKSARDILGKSTLKKVYFDRGFYDGEHFDWLNKAKRDALKEPVKIAERMVDVTNCEKRLRAIAVKNKAKKSIDILLTSIPASLCSAKGVIDEYRNRWGVEVFFKEEKSYWYLNKLPSRKINAVKCTIYFNFIAYNLISIFKKTLSEKYQNVGIKVLRSEVLRKNAIMYFNGDGFELEFNVKKTKEKYHEHIESISGFVTKMREKMDILESICLSY